MSTRIIAIVRASRLTVDMSCVRFTHNRTNVIGKYFVSSFLGGYGSAERARGGGKNFPFWINCTHYYEIHRQKIIRSLPALAPFHPPQTTIMVSIPDMLVVNAKHFSFLPKFTAS